MLDLDSMKNDSDDEVLKRLEQLSWKENETTIEVLLHLAEVERRKAFVPYGYSSLFCYCTQKLKYSEPAANRRVSCARVAARFPEVLPLLESRELSLSTLSLAAGIMTEENRGEVLDGIRGKGRRDVELYLSGYRPKESKCVERIRPVAVAKKRETQKEDRGRGGSLHGCRESSGTV